MRFMLATLLLAACDAPYSLGDQAAEISVAYCSRYEVCSGRTWKPLDVSECVRHSEFHLCDWNQSCGHDAPPGAEAKVDTCVLDMATEDCFWVAYGLAPDSCSSLLSGGHG